MNAATRQIEGAAMPAATLSEIHALRTLANPRAVELIRLMASGPWTIAGLAKETGLSSPATHQFLKPMRYAGFVAESVRIRHETGGTTKQYVLNLERFAQLGAFVSTLPFVFVPPLAEIQPLDSATVVPFEDDTEIGGGA